MHEIKKEQAQLAHAYSANCKAIASVHLYIISQSIYHSLNYIYSATSTGSLCRAPDLQFVDQSRVLGASVLYVYNLLTPPSPCSGDITAARLCYIVRLPITTTEESLTVGTLLILEGTGPLIIREILPFDVNPRSCNEARSLASDSEMLCCETRRLCSLLGLRALEGAPLGFRFALQTHVSMDTLGLREQQGGTAYGYTAPPLTGARVGDVIEVPEDNFNRSILMPIISFNVQGILKTGPGQEF